MKRDAKPTGAMPATVRKLRCAVYTRKSSEEGLDMEFNSLDAQREACEAYIASQRAEGWVALRDRYDDGGFSGGNMDRPALQRLLTQVDAGLIDTIVVYKIDRLTRALSDFARIVERLDRLVVQRGGGLWPGLHGGQRPAQGRQPGRQGHDELGRGGRHVVLG